MAELKNPKHEKFVQNIVRGLSRAEAYLSAGYSRNGAHASAARLLKNPQVCTRMAELQKVIAPLVEAAIIKLAVTDRLHRLEAIQDRWEVRPRRNRGPRGGYSRSTIAMNPRSRAACRRDLRRCHSNSPRPSLGLCPKWNRW